MRGKQNTVNAQPTTQLTLENVVAWYQQYKHKQPTNIKEYVDGLCEYHTGLSTEQIRALSAYHAQMILDPTASNRDKNDAFKAIIELRKIDVSIGFKMIDTAKDTPQPIPRVSDEQYKQSMIELLESTLENDEAIELHDNEVASIQQNEVVTIKMEDVG